LRLRFVFATEVAVVVHLIHNLFEIVVVRGRTIKTIHHVEFANFVVAQQGEVVLLTLVVDSIKLGESGLKARDLTISKEAPNLSQGHSKRLLRFCGLDLSSVKAVPSLEFRIVA
jgi:hypothetical protein